MTTRKRSQALGIRGRFLYTNLTEDEYNRISQHCRRKHISISQFFADLLLQEASRSKGKAQQKVTLQIELTPAEHEKLEQLARLHRKQSIVDFVREVLGPELRIQRLHAPAKTKHVRYYFSDDEHELVTKHMKQLGKSPSNYPAILALRATRKAAKKQTK
ncbi:MAG TPA: hypothetical protein VI685_18885 [Candidatus Angelobacter sp.]